MLEAIMTEAGYKVGLYTSPHLIRFNERFRVSKKDISDRALVDCVEAVRNAIRKAGGIKPTFFEFTTAVAFHYFKKQGQLPCFCPAHFRGFALPQVRPLAT